MADDFVTNAFNDARNALIDDETEMLIQTLEKQGDIAHLTAATRVGIDRMNELCRVAFQSGNGDALADYAQALLLTGFHMGYKAAIEKGHGI